MKKKLFVAGIAFFAVAPAAGAADAYPSRPIRLLVPFAEADAPGLGSRRPARGQGAQAAGLYKVAATISLSYPTKPIRLLVPFAPEYRLHLR